MEDGGRKSHGAGAHTTSPSSAMRFPLFLRHHHHLLLSLPFSSLTSVFIFYSASVSSTPWPCLFLSFLSLSPSCILFFFFFRYDSHRNSEWAATSPTLLTAWMGNMRLRVESHSPRLPQHSAAWLALGISSPHSDLTISLISLVSVPYPIDSDLLLKTGLVILHTTQNNNLGS